MNETVAYLAWFAAGLFIGHLSVLSYRKDKHDLEKPKIQIVKIEKLDLNKLLR